MGTYQGDLYRPMCGRSVAAQGDMFPGQGAKDPAPVRRPDLEGQVLLFAEARRVGPVNLATICAGCGATCPNAWSDPRGYVHVAGKVFCDADCEERAERDAPEVRAETRKALARLCDERRLTEDLYLWADWEMTVVRARPEAVVAELVKQGAITAEQGADITGGQS